MKKDIKLARSSDKPKAITIRKNKKTNTNKLFI